MKKSLLFIMSVMVLSLLLISCPDPGSGTGSATVTISGIVTDSYTGLPVSGVKIGFGPYTATTDAAGNYSIEAVENEVITGNFYISRGIEYIFEVFNGIDITPVSDLVYDRTIEGDLISSYTLKTISGRIFQSDGTTEIADNSSYSITIINENGGKSHYMDFYDSASGGYSLDTATFGTNCTLFIEADDTTPFNYYIENIDLSAASVTLDLTKPSTGFSTVTVTGIDGDSFNGSMKYSETIYFNQVYDSLSGTTTANVEIYNPDGKPFVWSTSTSQLDTPSAGDYTSKNISSSPAVPGTAVTLPVPTLAGASQAVDGTAVNYLSGELSFTGSADTDMYWMMLGPDSGATGGNIYSLTTSVSLPADILDIVTSTTDSSSSWDFTFISLNTDPVFDFDAFISGNGFNSDYSYSFVVGANQSTTDLIP